VRGIAIRLGAPACAGTSLRFTGAVTDEHVGGDERVLEVAVRAAGPYGHHATGTATLAVPLG
jgi:hypothetical protein